MALKDNDDVKPEGDEQDVSLDLSQAAVKRMIADAKERGYITYDQLNSVMPPEQVSSEQIEDVMSMLSEMGINIIENEEGEEAEAVGGELVETSATSREVVASYPGSIAVAAHRRLYGSSLHWLYGSCHHRRKGSCHHRNCRRNNKCT